ncbi:MAG: hypothetical protein ACTSQE_01805 [Candidatus Heimdallarchaeaceae archaeon]
MKDKVLVATVSVIIIAGTLSLLNIYVFPDMLFQVDVYRNTEKDHELEMLYSLENIGLASEMFESLNITYMYADIPEHAIMNISYMINQVENYQSGAFDTIRSLYDKDYIYMPVARNAKISYNGSIFYVGDSWAVYEKWVEKIYVGANNATYLVTKNETGGFDLKCNISEVGLSSFTLYGVKSEIENLFTNNETKPFYVVYQTVSYKESRGILKDYSTSFDRLIFLNLFGDIVFFLSNEGYWVKPLSFI